MQFKNFEGPLHQRCLTSIEFAQTKLTGWCDSFCSSYLNLILSTSCIAFPLEFLSWVIRWRAWDFNNLNEIMKASAWWRSCVKRPGRALLSVVPLVLSLWTKTMAIEKWSSNAEVTKNKFEETDLSWGRTVGRIRQQSKPKLIFDHVLCHARTPGPDQKGNPSQGVHKKVWKCERAKERRLATDLEPSRHS